MADVKAKDDRSSDEIRRDIERKRADMDDTVDRIEDRLSPGQVLDELWSRVKGSGGGGVGDVVRDHPVPLALMGLGLGWLAVEQATGKSASPGDGRSAGPGTAAPAEGRRGPYRGDAVHDSSEGLADKAKRKLRDAKESVSDAAAGARESVRSAAADARDRVTSDDDEWDDASWSSGSEEGTARRKAGEVKRQARHRARQAREGFWGAMEENPLALGALAFGLGLASGVSAPTTEAEDRLMGRTSDTLKGEAKRVAEDVGESAKAVAEDAAEAAAEEARRQKEDKDVGGPARQLEEQAKDAAGSVARAAKEAGKERAEREDLTKEGLKKKATRAGERTRQEAKREAERKKS